MATPARAPASAKAAPSRERTNGAIAPVRRPVAPAVQRVSPRAAPCACGGHCPKCTRNAPPAAPLAVSEDAAAEQEAEQIAQILLGSFSGSNPLPPPEENSGGNPSPFTYHRIAPTSAPLPSLGSGQPLPEAIRQRLEPVLGLDLSALRLHTDNAAHTLAQQHHARAFTYGSHLVFGAGEYSPHRTGGLKILAHEIVHAVQQSPRGSARAAHRADRSRIAPTAANAEALLSAPARSLSVPAQNPWASGIISHQARPRGPPAARAPPVTVRNHFAQPRVQCLSLPSWHDVSTAVVNTGAAALDTAADFGGAAVDLAVDVGEGAVELGSEVVEHTADFFIGLVDQFAPGLLEFLRGGFMPRLTDLFCRGLDAVIGGLVSSLENIDFVSVLEEAFTSAQQSVSGVIGSLGNTASEALGALMQPVVDALDQYGPGIIDAVSGAGDTVNGFFNSIWQAVGVPALDFLGDAGGAIWQEVTDLMSWLWDCTSGIREAAAEAWAWVSRQFGLAWDSTSGIRDWLAEKATAAWNSMLDALGPLRGPVEVLVAVLVLLSPMGPIVVATQVIPPLWDKLVWLWENWNTQDILVRAQDVLREQILPGIISTVSGVATTIAGAASWLAGLTVQVAQAFGGVLSIFGANHCLESVTRVLTAVSNQFTRLAAWAQGGFTGLGDAIATVFHALVAILQPILDFLVRLVLVVSNPPLLPIAITGAIWLLIPDRLKPPVINFVLDLILAFLRGMPAFLTGLWPMASLLKGAALGFLASIRIQTDELKIAATNKIAGLMAGGGLAFVAGFGVGLLEGVLDGVLDPFRIIWMLIRLTVAACRAIGTLLARLSPEFATGQDRLRTAVGAPAIDRNASILGTFAADVGLGETATARPAVDTSANGAAAPPTAHTASASAPAAEAASAHAAESTGPAIISHTGSADFARLTGTRPTAAPAGEADGGNPTADLMAGGPLPSDAEVAAAIGPGMASELSGSADTLDGADAEGEQGLQSTMRATQGSPRRLSQILGEAWDSAVAGATNIGASIAEALMRFILLPDYELGSKIGWVAGFVIFQLILMYLTAGVSAAGEAASPILRAVVSFLDLGGEILGMMGRALGRLAAPVGRLLAGAGRFVERIPGLGRIFSRFTRALRALLRFGEEAGGAVVSRVRRVTDPLGERVMRGVGLPEGAIADVMGHGVARTTSRTERALAGETADDVAARATRDAADSSATRAARDTTEDVAAQDTRRAASETEGAPPRETSQADEAQNAAAREGDEATNLARRKAEEMPGALAELELYCQTNDLIDTPMPILLAGLYGFFQPRYPWIHRFYAERLGLPHHYTIFMVASPPTPIDADYSDNDHPGVASTTPAAAPPPAPAATRPPRAPRARAPQPPPGSRPRVLLDDGRIVEIDPSRVRQEFGRDLRNRNPNAIGERLSVEGQQGTIIGSGEVPFTPGGRPRTAAPSTPGVRSTAPQDLPTLHVDYTTHPDSVPPGIVLEFPNGTKVWREADGGIAHETTVGPSSFRRGLEDNMPGPSEAGLPTRSSGGERLQDISGRAGPPPRAGYHRAHMHGQGTGFESPYGIRYSSDEINLTIQNEGIEEALRAMRDSLPEGATLHLRTKVNTVGTGSQRFREATYRVDYTPPGGSSSDRLFEITARTDGTITRPRSFVDLPEVFQGDEIPVLLDRLDIPQRVADRTARRQARVAAARAARRGGGVARSALGPAPTRVPASVPAALSGDGQPLPGNVRQQAESFFGADLGHVRVHDDALATTATAESRAHALAVGPNIMLSAQRRDLSRRENLGTLVHEIAHTLQCGTPSTPSSGFNSDNSREETEARQAAANFLSRPVPQTRSSASTQPCPGANKPAVSTGHHSTVMREPDEDTRRHQALASLDWMSAIPPIMMTDDAPVLIEWAQKKAAEFDDPNTSGEKRTYLAQGLLKAYEQLQQYETRATRGADGALIYRDVLTESETPWTEDRAKRLDAIPPFTPLDVVRWQTTASPMPTAPPRRQTPRSSPKTVPGKSPPTAPPPANAMNITFPKQKEMTLRTEEGQRTIMAFVIAATRRGITGDQIGWIVSQLDLKNRWTPPAGVDLTTWFDQFEAIPVGEKITLTITNSFSAEVDVLMMRKPSNRDFLLEGYRQGVLDARAGLYLGIGTFAVGTLALGGGVLLGSSLAAGGGTLGAGGLLGNGAGSLIGASFRETARMVGTYAYLNAPALYGSALLYTGAGLTGIALGQHLQQIRSNGLHWHDVPQFAGDLMPLAGGYADYQAYRTPRASSPDPEPATDNLPAAAASPPMNTAQKPGTPAAPSPNAAPPEPIDELAAMRAQRAAAQAARQTQASSGAADDSAATESSAPSYVVVGNTVRVVRPQPTPRPVPVASAAPQVAPAPNPQPQVAPAPAVQPVPKNPPPAPVPNPDPARTAISLSQSTGTATAPASTPAPAPVPVPVPAPAPAKDPRSSNPCQGPTGLTPADPIPIHWFKPLHDKNLYPSPIAMDGQSYSIDDPTTLPRGEPIGVAPVFRPVPGKIVQLLPETRSSGFDRDTGRFDSQTQRYRETLRSYGFDWGHRRYLQADHVMDLQWAPADYEGNRDQFNNMWPLDAPANTSAGNTQNNLQVVTFCETRNGPRRTISLREMKAEARTNPRQRFFGRYFIISSIGV